MDQLSSGGSVLFHVDLRQPRPARSLSAYPCANPVCLDPVTAPWFHEEGGEVLAYCSEECCEAHGESALDHFAVAHLSGPPATG